MLSLILLIALVLALLFSFWTGFTDAAYATSGIIATRAMKPIHAIALSSVASFIGMTMFGSAVAKTIGTGIISQNIASGEVIIAALGGALVFDIIFSWIFSLPISETHVVIGGLIGAGAAAGGANVIQFEGIIKKVVLPLIASPFIAIIVAVLITGLVIRTFGDFSSSKMNKYFKRLQIVSTFLFSITDATNDAQKVMGIITVLLMYYGHLVEFSVPLWVALVSYMTISMGTLLGGWRIVKTMAKKITLIKPYQGFCSDLGSSIMLGVAAIWGMPVSSTHVANGTIIGTGLTRGAKAVKWKTIRNIIWAWILSAPLSAIFSFLIYKGIELMI
jgi:PiT family inorganic phosphate transporter